ncbi:polyhomeotic-like protein 2 isoform X8 [Prionailurus iriomotensis]
MAGPPALPPPETAAAATTAAAASSSAASPHYQEWILDTIDSLRSRKARPDLERICRMVRRRHGPEPERTRAELEKLIQQRAVLRVSYKGSISYRNAARVQPPRRGATPPAPPRAPRGGPAAAAAAAAPPPTPAPPPPPAPVAAAAPARAPRAAAAAAATAPPSPGPAQPGPRAQRAAPLAAPPPAPAAPPAVAPPAGPRRAPPPAVAAREPPLPPPPQPPAPPQQQQQPPPPQPQQPPEGGAARAGGPARPVSLREVVRYLGGSGGAGGRLTRGRVQGLLEEEAAARGRLERTRLGALALPRGDRPGRAPPAASARASRSKRGGEERVLEKEEEEEDDEDEDDEDDVSEGSEVPEGDRPAGAQHHQLNGERGPQSAKERVKEWTPCGPLQGQDEGRGPAPGSGTRQVFSMAAMNKEGGSASAATGSGRKEKPADPVEWTVMDVVEYFTEAGFPEQATAFQEQEIDGKSLLLMQRTDVLTGLSIRLGPALKIYEHHIKVLQQGHFEDDDPDGFLG